MGVAGGRSRTGNIYALGVGATVVALTKDGKLLWERSIGEEFAAFTTHGGRTMSPLIDGDLVIVSSAVSNWGTMANRALRFIALDKRTGDIVYVATPGGRPYDTAYPSPLIATINGTRLLISGNGDGGVHAIKPQTGEKVWSFIAAKRAINTGVVVNGNNVIVSHGDENLDSSELGMIAAIDGGQMGDIKQTKWAVKGLQFGFSSPIIDGDRVYQIENGSKLRAFDVETGKELWRQDLGTVQKAPPVLADGKIYVGTESGKFFILRPGRSRRDAERSRAADQHEQRAAGRRHAGAGAGWRRDFARPRLLRVERCACTRSGRRRPKRLSGWAIDEPAVKARRCAGVPPGVADRARAEARADGQAARPAVRRRGPFSARGREGDLVARWSQGHGHRRHVRRGAGPDEQAGLHPRDVGRAEGRSARACRPPAAVDRDVRVVCGCALFRRAGSTRSPASSRWRRSTARRCFRSPPDETIFQRLRMFIGPVDWSNYTVEADVRVNTRRRQMGDIGITAQRYSLVLYGNTQKLKLEPWEPETERTVTVPFTWKPDKW